MGGQLLTKLLTIALGAHPPSTHFDMVDIYLSATHHPPPASPADAESLAQLDPSRTTDVDAYP